MQRGFVKKRGSTWTAFWYVGEGALRKQHSKGSFKTKSDATQYLNSTLKAIQEGEFVAPAKQPLGEYLVKRWFPTVKHHLRPSTYDSYVRIAEHHVLPYIGHVNLQALTVDHLDRLYAELLTRGRKARGKEGTPLAPKTVRLVHTLLHKALKDAVRKQLIVRNVAEAADPPKLRQSGSRDLQTWQPDEIRAFLHAVQDHSFAPAYVLAITTGMRRGEVLGLRWRDLDLTSRRLAVRQTVSLVNYRIVVGTPKTNRGRRSIALDDVTVEVLRAHQRRQLGERAVIGDGYVDNNLVFARHEGGPINPDLFSQVFDRTIKRLGLPKIRLHDLRHTHATLGLAAGVPPKVMADRLGHASVAFTLDTYTHAIPTLESSAADRLSVLIFGALPPGQPAAE